MSNTYNDEPPDHDDVDAMLEEQAAQAEKAVYGPDLVGNVVAPAPLPQGGETGLEAVKKAYIEMFGETMTAEQTTSLFQTAEKLKVRGDDGIWILLLALENYQRLYLNAPSVINSTVRLTIQQIRTESEAAAADAAQEVKREIAKIARKAAGISGWRRYLPFLIPAISIFVALLVGYLWGQFTNHSNLSVYFYQLLYK